MKLPRLCVCLTPTKCVCVLVCAGLSPTEIGLAIIVVPIWWKHYSFDVILYHISLWQAIREGDELFFHLRGREDEGGTFAFSLSAACCTTLLRVLQHAASVHKTDIQMSSSGQPVCSFSIHPHEETSESLINFWIINLRPLVGKSWTCGESLFSHWIHSNAFLQSTEHSFWVSHIYVYWTKKEF